MRRQLGQLRPTGTSAEVLFNPVDNKPYAINSITVCNTGAGQIKISIFHDVDGTTYDETTALVWELIVAVGGVYLYEPLGGIADFDKAGNLAVQTDTANDATFTAYGEIDGEVV